MQKCQSLVSKKVTISLLRGLGLVSDVKMNVSVSSRSRENVGRPRSRSRLGLKNKRLGLTPQSLVYITACHTNESSSTCPYNSAARAVTKTPTVHHITPILKSLHRNKINERFKYKVLSLTYKSLKTGQPSYLRYLFHSLHIVALGLLLLSPLVALLSTLVLK